MQRLIYLYLLQVIITSISFNVQTVFAEDNSVSIRGPKSSDAYTYDSYGPIKSNDTLWNIALKVRPDPRFTVYQVMQALVEQNPQAFVNNNVNHMVNGQYLKIPSIDKIRAIDASMAQKKSHLDDDTWQKQISAQDKKKKIASSIKKEDLVAATSEIKGSLEVIETKQKARLTTIQNDVLDSIDGLQHLLKENEELRQRLSKFDAQLSLMQKEVAKGKEIKMQMDSMIDLQQELLTKAQKREHELLLEKQQAELENGSLLNSTWFQILLSIVPASILLLVAYIFLRRKKSTSEDNLEESSTQEQPEEKLVEDVLNDKKENNEDNELSLDNELSEQESEQDNDDLFIDDLVPLDESDESDENEIRLDDEELLDLSEGLDELDEDTEHDNTALDDDLLTTTEPSENDELVELIDDINVVKQGDQGNSEEQNTDDKTDDVDLDEEASPQDEVDDIFDEVHANINTDKNNTFEEVGSDNELVNETNYDDLDDLDELDELILDGDKPEQIIEEELEDVSENIADISEELDEVPEDLADISEELDEVPEDLADVSKELDEVPEDLADVSKELDEVPEDLADVSEELDEESEDLADVSEEIEDIVADSNLDQTSVIEERTLEQLQSSISETQSPQSVDPLKDEMDLLLNPPEDGEVIHPGIKSNSDIADEVKEQTQNEVLQSGHETLDEEIEKLNINNEISEINNVEDFEEIFDAVAFSENEANSDVTRTDAIIEVNNPEDVDDLVDAIGLDSDKSEEQQTPTVITDIEDLDDLLSEAGNESLSAAVEYEVEKDLAEHNENVKKLNTLPEEYINSFLDENVSSSMLEEDGHIPHQVENNDIATNEAHPLKTVEAISDELELNQLSPANNDKLEHEEKIDIGDDLAPDFNDSNVLNELLNENEGNEINAIESTDIEELDNLDFDDLLANIKEESSISAEDNLTENISDIVTTDRIEKDADEAQEKNKDFISVDSLLSESFAQENSSEPYNADKIDVGLQDFPEFAGNDIDEDVDDNDMVAKLDLAMVYIDIGDKDNAEHILQDVIANGDAEEQFKAQQLIEKL